VIFECGAEVRAITPYRVFDIENSSSRHLLPEAERYGCYKFEFGADRTIRIRNLRYDRCRVVVQVTKAVIRGKNMVTLLMPEE
jgi:hypothetical protein